MMSPDYLQRLNRHNPPNIRMKSILSSMTIWGVLISLVARFFKVELTTGDGATLATQATEAWPVLVGVFADVTVAWKRVLATKFNVDWYASPTFWAAIVGGVMTALQAAGTDWQGLEGLPEKVAASVAAGGGLVGLILQLVGRAKATAPLGIIGENDNHVPLAAIPKLAVGTTVSIPTWAVLILKMIPWRVLFGYVLQKWLGITPAQFEEIIKTVAHVDGRPIAGAEKAVVVEGALTRAYPQLRPHEREAAVALAVAGLASDGQLKLS
jgi:hypothetical protein